MNLKKYGEWVVITGATDGIGKAYSEQMASKGNRSRPSMCCNRHNAGGQDNARCTVLLLKC